MRKRRTKESPAQPSCAAAASRNWAPRRPPLLPSDPSEDFILLGGLGGLGGLPPLPLRFWGHLEPFLPPPPPKRHQSHLEAFCALLLPPKMSLSPFLPVPPPIFSISPLFSPPSHPQEEPLFGDLPNFGAQIGVLSANALSQSPPQKKIAQNLPFFTHFGLLSPPLPPPLAQTSAAPTLCFPSSDFGGKTPKSIILSGILGRLKPRMLGAINEPSFPDGLIKTVLINPIHFRVLPGLLSSALPSPPSSKFSIFQPKTQRQ